jgi:hypothetical protein
VMVMVEPPVSVAAPSLDTARRSLPSLPAALHGMSSALPGVGATLPGVYAARHAALPSMIHSAEGSIAVEAPAAAVTAALRPESRRGRQDGRAIASAAALIIVCFRPMRIAPSEVAAFAAHALRNENRGKLCCSRCIK